MAFSRAKFLIEVLGPDGALSLAKAAERHDYLGQTLVPRSVLAWLAALPGWEGSIPGSDRELVFHKSESGFSGHVQLGETRYDFSETTIFHVAGAVATAVDLGDLAFGNVRNLELNRLGKSIDLMARVQVLSKTAKLASDASQEESSSAVYESKEPLGKDEGGHGSTAAPVAPAAPAAPTGSAPTPSAKQLGAKAGAAPPSAGMKPPKAPGTIKLTRSEADTLCGMCGQGQFLGDDFTGCRCFRELAKSVRTTTAATDSVTIDISKVDRDTLVTLLEAVGRL